jgi:hexosaminidase
MFSTGGDEVNLNCYTQDAQTQADLKSSNRTFDQALDDFLHAEHAGIRKLGKTPVVKEGLCPGWAHYPFGDRIIAHFALQI